VSKTRTYIRIGILELQKFPVNQLVGGSAKKMRSKSPYKCLLGPTSDNFRQLSKAEVAISKIGSGAFGLRPGISSTLSREVTSRQEDVALNRFVAVAHGARNDKRQDRAARLLR
jgi:hypothetical protein